jgi:ArsR family transcriptional regulator, arsenate/arsenite/antimonite-responsive transcriptional repressor
MDSDQQAHIFKAIGDPTRLRILQLLPAEPACGQMYNINELVEEIGGSQPNMSRHLQVLKAAGLVQCRKACSSVYYWRVSEAFERARAALGAFAQPTTAAPHAQPQRNSQPSSITADGFTSSQKENEQNVD